MNNFYRVLRAWGTCAMPIILLYKLTIKFDRWIWDDYRGIVKIEKD